MLQVEAYIAKYQADMQKSATGTIASRGNFLPGALFCFPKLSNSFVFSIRGNCFCHNFNSHAFCGFFLHEHAS